MKLVSTEAVMTAPCQHCDSHIEMCEECPMKELIESVPEATLPDAPEVEGCGSD